MNHLTPTGAAELPKCTAADGSTEVINVPGYPLMVRAVDFNRLRAKVEELSAAQAELAAMRAGGGLTKWRLQHHPDELPDGEVVDYPLQSGDFAEGWTEQLLYTSPQPPAQAADSVLEDAARWQMAVLVGKEVMLHPANRTHQNAVKAYMDAVHSGLDLTGAVDAARKQGANHD